MMSGQREARLQIKLNQAQREAVQTIDGSLLVIAGAGTGKTATLTARVAYMIEQGIEPDSILLLTFTRKAAQEMIDRAAGLFGTRCYEVEGGTFHSFAHTLLRKYGEYVGWKTFSMIDTADVEDIISYQMEEMNLIGSDSSFPSKRTARVIFGKSVNWGTSIEEVVKKEYGEYEDCVDDLKTLWDEVDWYKVFHGLLDYDDLLMYARKLLEEQPGLRVNLSWNHRYIMVDEYQDTNAIQAQIVRLLADCHDNVMAVGDDAQSIYAFRGANYRNILEFPEQFPGAKIVRLEENFRSVQPVLSLTNAVIGQAKAGFQKTLYSSRSSEMLPQLVHVNEESQQSEYVVQRIQELQQDGMLLSEMAVLIRSGFLSHDLELELGAAHLPFVKVGGLKFMEARHIKDMLAYLRVLGNIKDSLAWYRILTLIPGIGAKTAQKMFGQLLEQEQPFRWLAEYPGKGKFQEEVQRLGKVLSVSLPYAPSAQLERLIAYYLPFLREIEDSDQEYIRRQQGLDHLVIMAGKYQDTVSFLTNLALDPPNESSGEDLLVDEEDERPQDMLTISTIHSAKGLEWKAVFVLWLTEGRFPSLYAYEDEERLEEERRLLYVAMTRAKDELHLCVPEYFDYRAGMTFFQPSAFLQEIPETLYHARTGANGNSRNVAVCPFELQHV